MNTSNEPEPKGNDAADILVPQTFYQFLDACFGADKASIKRIWRKLQNHHKAGKPCDQLCTEVIDAMEASVLRCIARSEQELSITYDSQLPIADKKQDIAELIEANQIIVIAGETGSGKTTQIPKICLELGRGVKGYIGHTQPRRIAARTVASRIAQELQQELGGVIGYQVRFNDVLSDDTRVKLMTDGILLAEIQNDPLLHKYDTLIIDEAHERSLNIDFLLGYLKQLLPKRPDLKVIITSATIDLERFSQHFNDAPILSVSGRTYPVDIRYRPPAIDQDMTESIVEALQDLQSESSGQGGDVLVFLSGEREIRETALAIRKADLGHLDVLPLYARLSLQDQNRVFQSHRGRRVVLATNVAETSITVPGIRYVIDPGMARISRYSVRTKVQRLPLERISQASANQRAGRCGRVAAGICIRLYSQDDFDGLPEFTEPEILRTNLASVVLKMLHLRVGDIRDFPFIEAPEKKLISDGFKLLEALNAIDVKGQLTPLGRQINQLPIDPRLARILLEAKKYHCLREILIIVTALAVQDPRDRPHDKQQAADEKHRRFWDEESDLIAYVNLWNYLEEQRQELSHNQFRRMCQREFIAHLRVREWRELHHQLRLASKSIGLSENTEASNYESIHRALLAGLFENIGIKDDEKGSRDYIGTRSRRYHIFPGSSQTKKRPQWLMSASYLETSRLFGHGNAKIDVNWAVDAAKHLLKHHYFEPHYQAKSGQVMAFDRISLYGLTLVEKKRVNFAHIDPKTARKVFIRSAFVEGGYPKNGRRKVGAFYRHNQKKIDEINEMEAKARRRDLLVDDEILYQLYDERIPADVCQLSTFEAWRKKAEQSNPALLCFESHDITLRHDVNPEEAQFPDAIAINDQLYALSYRFDPGHKADGVSIHISTALLNEVSEARLQWLVPGILREKCIALIKALPKQIRKQFVPVPQFVDRVLPRLKACNEPLNDCLARELMHISEAKIPNDAWQGVELDSYYLMNIFVLDESDKIIDSGRDLTRLRERNKALVKESIKTVESPLEQKGITRWTFGDLPESTMIQQGKVRLKAYPALQDKGDSISVTMVESPEQSSLLNRRGLARLLALTDNQTAKYLRKELFRHKEIGLAVVDWGTRQVVAEDIVLKAFYDACIGESTPPTSQADFDAALERGRNEVIKVAYAYEKTIQAMLEHVLAIRKMMKNSKNALALAKCFVDVNQQLALLLDKQALFATPAAWFNEIPRYLRAIELRLEKAASNTSKDSASTNEVAALWAKHEARLQAQGESRYYLDPKWQEYRWMIEELRVSLFAQTLKTIRPVSRKRLDKLWAELV